MLKLLFKLKLTSLLNRLKFTFSQNKSRFGIGVFTIFLGIGGIYLGVSLGFKFIFSLGPTASILIPRLISLLFFMLFFLVGLSFSIIFFQTALKGEETNFLLTFPIRIEKIFIFKFLECLFFACWIPLIGIFFFFLAYGFYSNLSIFAPILSLLLNIFSFFISSFLFSLTLLLLLRYFNIRKIFIFIAILTSGLVIYHIFFSKVNQTSDTFYILGEDFIFLKVANIFFLPFSWASKAFLAFQSQDREAFFIYFANLFTLSLALGSFLPLFKKNFLLCYDKYVSQSAGEKISSSFLDKLLSFIPEVSLKPFIVKDTKLLFRDPTFVIQFFIFFGILFFYFLNLRKFSYHNLQPAWKIFLTFLNTFSILSVASSLGVRFIFPQWSLEGRNFWIVKLAPPSLKKIFLAKLFLNLFIFISVAFILIFTSNYFLALDFKVFLFSVFLVICATGASVSISLGLGGYFSDFKQKHYIKVIESIGGLITLSFNFIYIFSTVVFFFFLFRALSTKTISHFWVYCFSLIWFIFSVAIAFFCIFSGIKRLKTVDY